MTLSWLAAQAWTQPVLAEQTQVITHDHRVTNPGVLRAAFTMRLREWPDGTPVRVFVLPDQNPLHEKFCREQLAVYPYALRRIWDRLVFTGTGFAPQTVRSEQEMLDRVAQTPGAIGYRSGTPARGNP
jgi:hypothetical protein